MKKRLISALCLLLCVTTLCGCSLFSGKDEESAVTDTVVSSAVEETEALVLEDWGTAFSAEGTDQQIAYAFLTTVFQDTWNARFSCSVRTEITKWGISDRNEDGLIPVYLTFAVFTSEPTAEDTAILSEGNVQAGKDDYEGAVILTRYCYLKPLSDGNWQCIGFGLS